VHATRVLRRPGDRTRARRGVTQILDREWVLSSTWCVFGVQNSISGCFELGARGVDVTMAMAMVITCTSVGFHCSMAAARRAGSRIPILAENPGGNSASRMAAICACASATFDLIGLINATRVLCEFK